MLTILLSMNRAFDSFYLLITGTSFDIAGESIKSVKIVMLVTGFVFSFFLAGFAYYRFSLYQMDKARETSLKETQKELIQHIDQGREAWNRFVTAGPNQENDFSGMDLSKRKFVGFFFSGADFNNCNLSDTEFIDCHLGYTDFVNAVCERTTFRDSYLKSANFKNADLKDTDFSGAYADIADFYNASIATETLNGLKKPKTSRWNDVSWYDYHDPQWLQEKNYYSGSRPPKGLKP
jgi:hypothetical protein